MSKPESSGAKCAIMDAQRWTGADWTHELVRHGAPVRDADEDPVWCDSTTADTCETCARARADAARAAELGDAAIARLETGDWAGALEKAREAAAIERSHGDDPSWSLAVKALQCEAHEAELEPCTSAPTALVDWMPPHLRASHEAARNAGTYPHNGAKRLNLCTACAAALADGDPS